MLKTMGNLSERLHMLRKEAGLTQINAAKALQIPYSTYRRYEGGERSPDVPILIQIADYYQVTIDYLVGRTDQR